MFDTVGGVIEFFGRTDVSERIVDVITNSVVSQGRHDVKWTVRNPKIELVGVRFVVDRGSGIE